jgi:hypothetical protein
MMPNQVIYDCNTAISLATCVGSYMGVSYMPVLRLPKIKFKSAQIIWKKEPKVNYTLYKIENRLYSINDEKNDTCVQSLKNSSSLQNKNIKTKIQEKRQNPSSSNTQSSSRNPQNPQNPASSNTQSSSSSGLGSCSIL